MSEPVALLTLWLITRTEINSGRIEEIVPHRIGRHYYAPDTITQDSNFTDSFGERDVLGQADGL
jgi:hypothetical protein